MCSILSFENLHPADLFDTKRSGKIQMTNRKSSLTAEYPAQSFASHWIRIATIVIYLVLQSTPTHVDELVMEWQGILQLLLSEIFYNCVVNDRESIPIFQVNKICVQKIFKKCINSGKSSKAGSYLHTSNVMPSSGISWNIARLIVYFLVLAMHTQTGDGGGGLLPYVGIFVCAAPKGINF